MRPKPSPQRPERLCTALLESRPISKLVAALAVVLSGGVAALSGCGGQGKAAAGETAELRRELDAERQKSRALAGSVAKLKADVAALQTRLMPLQQRTGVAAFDGGQLKRGSGASVELVNGTVVSAAGGRGKKVSLRKHLAARRGAVIGFWATWCKPCIADEELAHLKRLQVELGRYDVDLVSVLIDDLDKAIGHEKAARWLYPLWFVKDGHMAMLPRALVQRVGLGLPLFVLVTPDGAVKWLHGGKLQDAAVVDLITAAALL